MKLLALQEIEKLESNASSKEVVEIHLSKEKL